MDMENVEINIITTHDTNPFIRRTPATPKESNNPPILLVFYAEVHYNAVKFLEAKKVAYDESDEEEDQDDEDDFEGESF